MRKDVRGGGGVGARHRDSDTCDEVREGGGVIWGEACSDSECASSDRGVGSAGWVNEELAGGGEVRGGVGGSECEAEVGASSESIMNKELTANVVSSISASVVVGRVDRGEENAVELGDIGDEEVSMLVFNPRGAVRQNDNRDTVSVSVVDEGMAEEFSADTFFVIGEDNGVDTAAEGVMNEGCELIKEAVVVVCIVIEI